MKSSNSMEYREWNTLDVDGDMLDSHGNTVPVEARDEILLLRAERDEALSIKAQALEDSGRQRQRAERAEKERDVLLLVRDRAIRAEGERNTAIHTRNAERSRHNDELMALVKERDALAEKVGRMRKALGLYADKGLWTGRPSKFTGAITTAAALDHGTVARAALADDGGTT